MGPRTGEAVWQSTLVLLVLRLRDPLRASDLALRCPHQQGLTALSPLRPLEEKALTFKPKPPLHVTRMDLGSRNT
jgi:hypothetical protein